MINNNKYYLNYYNIYKLRKSMIFLKSIFTKNLYYLCQNPNAISYIEKELIIRDKIIDIYIDALSKNENGIELLYKYKLFYNIQYNTSLSNNPNSLSIFKKYPNLIDWYWYSMNPNGLEIIKDNLDKVNWFSLCQNLNPIVIDIIKMNMDKISWIFLSENKNALDILNKNIDSIDWTYLAFNSNSNIVSLYENKFNSCNNIDDIKNIDTIFTFLSRNKNAVSLLRKYPDKINWEYLSSNESDEAINLLEENFDKINWSNLSKNENLNAIKLLENNPNKIDWYKILQNKNAIELIEKYLDIIPIMNKSVLLLNPNIFEIDYNFIKKRMDIIREELLIKALHPNRVCKWIEEKID